MSSTARQRLELQRRIGQCRPVHQRYAADLAREDETIAAFAPELEAAQREQRTAENEYVRLMNASYTPVDMSDMGHPGHLQGNQHPDAIPFWSRFQAAKAALEPLEREMERLREVRIWQAKRLADATADLARWQAELAELEAVAIA